MQKNLYIFYLTQEWDSCNRRPMILEMARQLPGSDFLCINRPADGLTAPLKHRNRLLEAFHPQKRFRREAGNVVVFRPFYLCHEQLAGKTINRWNGRLLNRQIQNLNLSLDSYAHVCQWIYCPRFFPITQGFQKDSRLIFELYDEITLTPWDAIDQVTARAEPDALERADLIFTLTGRIKAKRGAYQDKCFVMGNAVEFDLFSKAVGCPELPTDMQAIYRPTIGLVGNLRNWIDFPLLQEMLERRPDWSFVLIGPVEKNIQSTLQSLQRPNLYLLGNKPKRDLYRYLAGIDVGIIPYLQSEFIRSSRPLKMLEFLAAGIPVVTVPVDVGSQAEIPGALYFAEDALEFLNKIEVLLSMEKPFVVAQCQSFAQKNQWSDVVTHVVESMGSRWGKDEP